MFGWLVLYSRWSFLLLLVVVELLLCHFLRQHRKTFLLLANLTLGVLASWVISDSPSLSGVVKLVFLFLWASFWYLLSSHLQNQQKIEALQVKLLGSEEEKESLVNLYKQRYIVGREEREPKEKRKLREAEREAEASKRGESEKLAKLMEKELKKVEREYARRYKEHKEALEEEYNLKLSEFKSDYDNKVKQVNMLSEEVERYKLNVSPFRSKSPEASMKKKSEIAHKLETKKQILPFEDSEEEDLKGKEEID